MTLVGDTSLPPLDPSRTARARAGGSAPDPVAAGLARGSRVAFAQLLAQHAGPVRAYLARHLERTSDAEDLAQDVFLIVLQGRSPFRGEASLRTWLLGIARNRLLTFLRDQGRRRVRHGDELGEALLEAQIEVLAEQVESEDHYAALRNCLARLLPRQRQLVERHYGRGESAESIGRAQGRSAGSVRMALLRARARLRACIEGTRRTAT